MSTKEVKCTSTYSAKSNLSQILLEKQFSNKRSIVSDSFGDKQTVFDPKLGRSVQLSHLNIFSIATLQSDTSHSGSKIRKCNDTCHESGYESMINDDIKSTLMDSFVLRKKLNESNHSIEAVLTIKDNSLNINSNNKTTTTNNNIINNSNNTSNNNNNGSSWSVTPKNRLYKDLESTQEYTNSKFNKLDSITPRKLIEYNPSKCITMKPQESKIWDNPVLGVDIQDILPSVSSKRTSHSNFDKIYNRISFSKSMLNHVVVIGQVEDKFIACVLNDSEKGNVLVLIDQHAAHERVRLEKLLRQIGYYEPKASINALNHSVCRLIPPAEVLFYENEIDLLLHYTNKFNEVGLKFSVNKKKLTSPLRKVYVSSVPCVFVNVCQPQVEAKGSRVNSALIKEFVLEQSKMLRHGIGKCNISSPAIFKVLASYACHGAIKFGDKLERTTCISLVDELSRCHLPFQCAHGRPSIAPLLKLSMVSPMYKSMQPRKPNLSILRHKINDGI